MNACCLSVCLSRLEDCVRPPEEQQVLSAIEQYPSSSNAPPPPFLPSKTDLWDLKVAWIKDTVCPLPIHTVYIDLQDTWPFWGYPCMARDASISVSSSSPPQGQWWVPLETGSLYQTGEQVASIACYLCAFCKSRSKAGGSATLGTAHKCFAVGAPYGPCLWRIPRP